MKKKAAPRVLFISHKANRSGAPLLLLEIMNAFSQTNIPFKIISMEEGELLPCFKKIAPTFLWQRKKTSTPNRMITPLQSFFFGLLHICNSMLVLWRVRKTTVVFYNTIVHGHVQRKLSFLRAQHICYVHELEAAIHMLTNKAGLDFVLKHTNVFLCVSMAVKNNLANNHGINDSKLCVIPAPAPLAVTGRDQYSGVIVSFLRTLTSAAVEPVVIGVTGANEWRKGFDYFFPLVQLYYQLFPQAETYFVWKGFRSDYYTSWFDSYDYNKIACRDKILLLPYDNASIEQMAAYDIHLLLSREDPYPLVVLEAAALGIPTACFSGAGGASEFVENDCGFTVPYGDLYAMAVELHALALDKQQRKELGKNCQRKLQERHDKQDRLKDIVSLISGLAVIGPQPVKP